MLIDLINQAQVSASFNPAAALTQATAGAAVDMANCQEPIAGVVQWGTPGAGQTSATVQIEECDTTNGTFTAIAGAVVTVTGTLAGVAVLRGLRAKQYARLNAPAVTGTTPSLLVSGVLIQQRKYGPPGSGVDRYPSS